MNTKPLYFIATVGILLGIISVIVYNETVIPLPPVAVSYNPYKVGIYATGIVESLQTNGSNVSIYSEVAGRVARIFLKNGQTVKKGQPIFMINNNVQTAVVAKDLAQLHAAMQNLINVTKQLEKIKKSYRLNPQSVSLNALDNAIYTANIAVENVSVAKAQSQADKALLAKYIVRAPINGRILRIVPAIGDYASPQGCYDIYTQGYLPAVQMGNVSPYMQVRAFVDEILTAKLPKPAKLQATMFIRGLDNYSVPLKYISIQPYTIPNIELSDQRNERVDVRVLPIIFKFTKPKDINIFPGQMVDVYIKGNA